jgi:hypothetical protein
LLVGERDLGARKEIDDGDHVVVYAEQSDPAAIVGAGESLVGRFAWGTKDPTIYGRGCRGALSYLAGRTIRATVGPWAPAVATMLRHDTSCRRQPSARGHAGR